MSNYKLIKNTEWKEVEINGEDKEIPKFWSKKTVADFVKLKGDLKKGPFGSSITKSMFVDSGIKVYEQKNAIQKDFKLGNSYVTNLKAEELNGFRVEPGDFIMSCAGTIGEIYKLPKNAPSGIINQALIKMKISDEIINHSYFEFLFQFDLFRKGFSSDGGIIVNFNLDTLRKVECGLPNLETQSSISSILSEQESVIENIEQLIEKYKQRFQYLSDELLSGKLRVKEVDGEVVLYKNPDDNWKEVEINGEMKEIPSDWQVDKISNVADFKNGYAFNKNDYSENKKYALIEVGNINLTGFLQIKKENKYIENITKKIESFILNQNDIVLPMTDMSHERIHVGTPAIINEDNRFILNQRVGAIKLKDKEIVQYVYFCIKNNQSYFGNNTVGGTYNMGTETIKDFEFKSPNKIEKIYISEILNNQRFLISNLEIYLSKEKQKLNWLLDNLLSGKYLIQTKEKI